MVLMESLPRIVCKIMQPALKKHKKILEYEKLKEMMQSYLALVTIVSLGSVPYISKEIWHSYVQSFVENYLCLFSSDDFSKTPYMVFFF